ncbi:MAG: PrgI family protein [bacterium]
MRTTVVPAQITTVEDRIAGNLTFVQILLLIVAMISGSTIYLLMPPHLKLDAYKAFFITLAIATFGAMAIRIKGRIVADWIVLLLRYYLRPRIYVYTKCDPVYRDLFIPVKERSTTRAPETKHTAKIIKPLSLAEQVHLDRLIANQALTITFSLKKKGGIDVSLIPYEN